MKSRLQQHDLTTGETAALCAVSARTVSKWIDSGLLNGYRIPGSKYRRVSRKDLETFLSSNGMIRALAALQGNHLKGA